MITISNLHKGFSAQELFNGAGLAVGARDRLAVVGPNGSGKTTLFEMIAGLQDPDSGSIETTRGVTLGYLPQTTDALRGKTIIDEITAAAPAMAAKHRLDVLHEEIAGNPGDGALQKEYSRLLERFESLEGYSAEARARQIAHGLGFDDAQLDGMTDALSGGWLMRVALAKLLVAGPDALLLDEPTNHLDLESVRWLETFLSNEFEGAVLLISHDRDFMNGFAGRVVEIEERQLVSYTGNYESFVQQREQRALQAAAAAANQQRRVEQLEIFINRFRYKKTKASQVQSKLKLLDRMEDIDVPETRRRAMKAGFPPAPRSGRIVLSLEGASFSYGKTRVYDGLEFAVERGQKIALVGPNGAGKSTLLKLCAGVLTPDRGTRALGANVSLGYFAQHQIEALQAANRVIEELESVAPPGFVRSRDVLGRFLFSGNDVNKRVSVLSGGERSRLAMARVLVAAPNFLCLDEPTNHLDIWSRDALEDALEGYDGAMLLITHDRHLIRAVAGVIAEVRNGAVRVFPGSYDEYLERIEREEALPAAARPPSSAAKERRRAGAADRAAANKHKAALRKVESELEAVHERVKDMEQRMADPSFYSGEPDVAAFMRTYTLTKERIGKLEAEWDRLTDER